MASKRAEDTRSSRSLGHRPLPSQETNASAIADSTISFGTMSQFPEPPSSVPSPTDRTASPVFSSYTASPPSTPRGPRNLRPPLPSTLPSKNGRTEYAASAARTTPTRAASASTSGTLPARAQKTSLQASRTSPAPTVGRSEISRSGDALLDVLQRTGSSSTMSPSDWHEGASSIDVDPTEERLLSTSFITSLLRETPNFHIDQHSVLSDGMSEISEMTYPPPLPYPHTSFPSRHVYLPSSPTSSLSGRPRGARPLPHSLSPAFDEAGSLTGMSARTFDDADTLTSNGDRTPFIRPTTTSNSPGPRDVRGPSIVGIARATLRHANALSDDPSPSTFNTHWREIGKSPLSDGTNASTPHLGESSGGQKGGVSPVTPASGTWDWLSRDPARQSKETRRSKDTRQSIGSTKSSFISRFSTTSGSKSGKSIRQAMSWLRKPLPPVPTLPHLSIAAEIQHRKAEESLALPDLVDRAGRLSRMLENGYHPHHSLDSRYGPLNGNYAHDGLSKSPEHLGRPEKHELLVPSSDTHRSRWHNSESDGSGRSSHPLKRIRLTKKNLIIALCICVVAIVIAVPVGVVVGRKKHSQPSCPGNLAGTACNLDATCVCTSSSSSTTQCVSLSQNLVSLTPIMNSMFQVNFTTDAVARSIWMAQGAPSGNNCACQAALVDVASALDPVLFPNRTAWAQSALLWNLVQSLDLDAASIMRKFISGAPWSDLGTVDAPVADNSSSFATTVSGFQFNFAAQTITQPSVSFLADGQPTQDQISRVGSTAQSSLDRMYSYALASATQQQKALSLYWTGALQQKAKDLPVFLSSLMAAPILLPFDATFAQAGHSITDLMTNSGPFPPPLACSPALNSTQLRLVNSVETTVFGLTSAPAATSFDTSCFPDRPVYGILDVLQLRLPFIDSRTGLAMQAAVLRREVAPRVVLYNGELLSAIPNSPNITTPTAMQLDPRHYGTVNHLHHVVYNWLSSISDVNVAVALVNFVLSSQALPPANTSILLQSLGSIPSLEVAVFGTVGPSDMAHTVSSFATANGQLFFGSTQSSALRNWTFSAVGATLVWADSATAPSAVYDASLNDADFNSVWSVAAQALQFHVPGVGVSNVTNSFRAIGKFSP